MKERKWVTAAEFLAERAKDPEYVARERKRVEERKRLEEEYERAEKPLVQDLEAAGFPVRSVYDFVNTTRSYRGALPILLDHLQRSYPPVIREGIARALAVREARFAWPSLVRLYREEPNEQVKSGLAVAVANTADKSVAHELIGLIREPQLGDSRLLLLSALPRLGRDRARELLEELQTDPQLGKEARIRLRRLDRNSKRAR
jgi:HEAT repeat protein